MGPRRLAKAKYWLLVFSLVGSTLMSFAAKAQTTGSFPAPSSNATEPNSTSSSEPAPTAPQGTSTPLPEPEMSSDFEPPTGSLSQVPASAAAQGVAPLPTYRLMYHEGDPIPEGYVVQEEPDLRLVTVGSVLLGTGYVVALLAASLDDTSDAWSYVPAVGPAVALTTRDLGCGQLQADSAVAEQHECSQRVANEVRFVSLAVLSGVLQLTGVTLLGVGLGQSHSSLVSARAHVSANVGRSGAGLELRGSF